MKLDGWFRPSDEGLVLAVPAGALVKQGLRMLLVLPICAAVAWLYGAGEGDMVLTVGIGGLLGVVALPLAILGLVNVARARSIAEASRVVVKGGRITHAGGSLPASAVRGLVVRRQSVWLAHLVLDAEVANPPPGSADPWIAPAEGRLRLLRNVPPNAGDELAELGRRVADLLGVTLRVEGGVDKASTFGMTPTTVAMLCYVPVQGLFLFFSVGVLVIGSSDPLVRFHARQSLALFGAEILAFVAAGGAVFAAMAIAGEEAGLVVGMVGLGGVAVGRLVLRVVASYRAYHYQAWVVPGLGWLTERWLPPGDRSSATLS